MKMVMVGSYPADSDTALAIEDPRALEVSQPMDGFRGKLAEDEAMSIRTTTRISTRNRALNGCDYEKMILERFDDIEKVCCIPVAKDSSDVRIVVFPHPEKRVLPQLPNWKLAEIEQYIKSFVSPFAKIRVVNPTYETITINMTAILKKDGDADERGGDYTDVSTISLCRGSSRRNYQRTRQTLLV